MKRFLFLLAALLPTMLFAQTIEPYFGKNAKGSAKAVQRYFKKDFKRPKGVNYDTSARIEVAVIIDQMGQVVIIDPEKITVEATVYTTVVETERYYQGHNTVVGTHTSVMGGDSKKGENEKSESEILREAIIAWLPTMPAWTPGTVDGQPQPMPVSFNLEY